MTRELRVDYATVQFVVTAYLLGLGLFQPIQGLLADRFGRRPVLLGGYSLFLLASLLAGAASQLWTLVAARFLQAMGISVATVVTRAIVRDSFEPGPAASALSFITAVMGLAPVVAPIVGGFAAETLGWRGIFFDPCRRYHDAAARHGLETQRNPTDRHRIDDTDGTRTFGGRAPAR